MHASERRSTRRAAVVLLALAATACSGGGGTSGVGGGLSSAGGSAATCHLIAQLPAIGEQVSKADITDPVKFNNALAAAVRDYSRTLDEIAQRMPTALHNKIELVRSAVEQYKFLDAKEARAPLDDWATAHC